MKRKIFDAIDVIFVEPEGHIAGYALGKQIRWQRVTQKKQFHSRDEGQYYVGLNALCWKGCSVPRFSPSSSSCYTRPTASRGEFWNTFKLISLVSLILPAICPYKATAFASISFLDSYA